MTLRQTVGLALAVVCGASLPVQAQLAGHGGPVKAVAMAPAQDRAVSGSFDYAVMFWDMKDTRALATLHGHQAAVNAVHMLPDGTALSASDDGDILLWQADRAEPLRKFTGHQGRVVALDVSPSGEIVGSAAWDGTARLWDLASGSEIRRFEGHQGSVNDIAFSPDGLLVATAGYDATIRVWRAADGVQIRELRGHDFGVNAVLFSHDGKRLISGGTDESIRLWDVEKGTELQALLGHRGPVLDLARAPQGAGFASSGIDGTVRLWRRPEDKPQVFGPPQGVRGGAVWSVAFSGDGTRLLAGGNDGLVRLWDIATGQEIRDAKPVAAASPAAPAAVLTSAELERGAALFRRCGPCHTVTPDGGNRAGPTLHNIFGRRMGSVEGYPYSPALRKGDIVWTAETVGDLFTRGPDVVTPGSKMPLQKLVSPEDREALIDYLKVVTQ